MECSYPLVGIVPQYPFALVELGGVDFGDSTVVGPYGVSSAALRVAVTAGLLSLPLYGGRSSADEPWLAWSAVEAWRG